MSQLDAVRSRAVNAYIRNINVRLEWLKVSKRFHLGGSPTTDQYWITFGSGDPDTDVMTLEKLLVYLRGVCNGLEFAAEARTGVEDE